MKSLFLNKLLCIYMIFLIGNSYSKEDEIGWTDATVIDSGSESVDGCGILIEIGENYCSPVSINDSYAVHRQEVKIKHVLQDDYKACGFGALTSYQKIDITRIGRK